MVLGVTTPLDADSPPNVVPSQTPLPAQQLPTCHNHTLPTACYTLTGLVAVGYLWKHTALNKFTTAFSPAVFLISGMPDARFLSLGVDITAHLTEAHTKGITSVAFNENGSFLATAGLDGHVCIWDVRTWSLLDTWAAKTPVTSLAWFTDHALICGLSDGILASFHKYEEGRAISEISGYWAHHHPVEHIACRASGRVVSGAQKELTVWDWNVNTHQTELVKKLPIPGDDDAGDDLVEGVIADEILITGVFWLDTSLVVTYMDHGIYFFDSQTWTRTKTLRPKLEPPRPIGRSCISPDGELIAISNVVSGFDICRLDTGELYRSFEHEIGEKEYATPVLFIHGGLAIVGGSAVGRVGVWYIESRMELVPLRIPNRCKVLALASYYDSQEDRFLIATGIMNEDAPSATVIWTAIPEQPATPPTQNEKDIVNHTPRGREQVLLIRQGWVFAYLAALGVLAAIFYALTVSEGEEREAFDAVHFDEWE
ncbi:WD40 repeat-like protein [Lentinus brumalis]|uniref:WD40 repeat-like protein n=1 Tax=Lentinus brumalis TaxID=2498619 RepID=A0A371CHY2_9APHY|nr:WD40 repeat-like protein [Polyporus brumalis]